MTKKITKAVILITIFGWIGWDVYAAIESTPGDTESEILRDWSSAHPALPFAIGALMGHFFWNREGGRFFKLSPLVLAILGVSATVLDATGVLPSMLPIIPFAIGIPLGALLWPQTKATK